MLRNLSDAVDWLLSVLTPHERAALKAMQESDLLDLHFSIGANIRAKMTADLLRAIADDAREETFTQVRGWCRSIGVKSGVEEIPPMFRRLLEREALLPDEASNLILHHAWKRVREEATA